METEQLEKQFQFWNHFLYMILGSSVTFVLILEASVSAEYKLLLVASAIMIVLGYVRALKNTSVLQDEMFP